MGNIGVKAYCLAHRAAKRALGRRAEPNAAFFPVYSAEEAACTLEEIRSVAPAGVRVNEVPVSEATAADLFWGENAVCPATGSASLPAGAAPGGQPAYDTPDDAWRGLVAASVVPPGWRNSGLHTTCWSDVFLGWRLSSWVWTSAALARYHALTGDVAGLARVADALLALQRTDGGWVVRFDYIGGLTSPVAAPNDSAYIASNAMLAAYEATGDERYLDSAVRCADWVMGTSHEDGLVQHGYDTFRERWVDDVTIVDVGFTGSLFARLGEATGEARYLDFLRRFEDAYVAAFRDPATGAFWTSVDGLRRRQGGTFARGQAWALEGLVPAWEALGADAYRDVVDGTVAFLVASQLKDGSWPYNASKRLLGSDCKGTPVIARALAEWATLTGCEDAAAAARRALGWCCANTRLTGPGAGGIFSFSMEGCVTHGLYSSAAFTYASSYALEAASLLEGAGL